MRELIFQYGAIMLVIMVVAVIFFKISDIFKKREMKLLQNLSRIIAITASIAAVCALLLVASIVIRAFLMKN